MTRTYQEEFFRRMCMNTNVTFRKGGLEKIILSVFSVGLFLLFVIGRWIFNLIKEGIEKEKENKIKQAYLDKFKYDLKLNDYVIYYKLIEGSLDNSYGELNQKVNFISYSTEKEDFCNIDKTLQQVLKYFNYDLRFVKGQYLHDKNRRYVFVTDSELDYIAEMLKAGLGVPVKFRGFN